MWLSSTSGICSWGNNLRYETPWLISKYSKFPWVLSDFLWIMITKHDFKSLFWNKIISLVCQDSRGKIIFPLPIYDIVWSFELFTNEHPAESQERQYPGGGYDQPVQQTGGLRDAPASQHDVPHPLHSLGEGQQPGHGHHPLAGHGNQGPDDAAHDHLLQTDANREFHSVRRSVTHWRLLIQISRKVYW